MDNLIVELDCIIKARDSSDGKRLVEVESSNESVDSEGDVILQRALLDSADSFIKTGHLDIDHISEIGDRMGIPNPNSYIIGRPIEVKDLGGGRTSVVGEIRRSADGIHNPDRNRYDSFWDTLKSEPPVRWRASIYGFPIKGMVDDCREKTCEGGATRYLVKGIDWRSLAFTRNPVNDAIQTYAHVVTAKAFGEMIKSLEGFPVAALSMGAMPAPRSMDEMAGQYLRHIVRGCDHAGGINTTVGFRRHFEVCCGMDPVQADIWAHALMHHVTLENRRNR